MLVPGIVSATFKGRSIEDVLTITRKAGLGAIEWSENHHIPRGDLQLAKEAALKSRDNGLEIAGYGSYYRLGQEMDLRPSLDTAAAMGADSVRIWAGSKPSRALEKAERDALLEELQEATEIAESYGMVLNLEWHKNTLTDENQSGLDTLSYIKSPWLRTLWQPTQALSFDERADGLKMILPYLSYLHVYYWDETGRRPFEEGLNHWERYFSLLEKEKKYYALLEFVLGDTEEQFYRDAAALIALLHKGV
ncbi:MAG: sugar phosphate isomerase/epimerase [Spirochaetales bacterium]|nr:sugar phosphate isomerase/epimerase [Candidatus Physcosoma equi]